MYKNGKLFLRPICNLLRTERSSMAERSERFGVRSRKLSNVGQSLNGCPKIYYLELLRASEGTFSRWSRLHSQSLAPTNPHWACVVGYGPCSLCVIHKEGLCPSSGDINRLMMICNLLRTHLPAPLRGRSLVLKVFLIVFGKLGI
jgi:hypothetical protein